MKYECDDCDCISHEQCLNCIHYHRAELLNDYVNELNAGERTSPEDFLKRRGSEDPELRDVLVTALLIERMREDAK